MPVYHAPAKLNLNLHILGRRESDGYHLIQSLITFTQWGDRIEITEGADALAFTVSGPQAYLFHDDPALLSTDRDSKNLVMRAVYMMADKAGRKPDIHIHLDKHIPAGAGLGGGSSDAAAVMKALNKLWDINLSLDDLCTMGLRLGADLPACLYGKPCQVSGIGDHITPIGDLPSLFCAIIWPNTPLSAGEVYRQYHSFAAARSAPDSDASVSADASAPPACSFIHKDNFMSIIEETRNDLTPAAIAICPEIKNMLNNLSSVPECLLARMSGSGSACFALFETEDQAQTVRQTWPDAIITPF